MSTENSENRLIIAGFGGQGILTTGKLLCSSCIAEGKNVTFLPSYGSEVRGGTANCHVVVSSNEIYGPSVEHADAMMILNELSMVRFGDNIKKDGLLLLNSSMIDVDSTRFGTGNVFPIAATRTASELGNVIVANILMLGAFIALSGICRIETAEASIRGWLEERGKSEKLPLNLKALHHGTELAESGISLHNKT